jgi:hypothetical protein
VNYSTVFDLSGSPDVVGVSFVDIAPLLAAALIVFMAVRGNRPARIGRRWLPFVVVALVGVSVLSIASSLSIPSSSTILANAISAGKGHVVEGTVDNFVAGSVRTKRLESFSVGGVPFSYAEGINTGGFNSTAELGGPIHAGLHVQIQFVRTVDVFPTSSSVGNIITRLDIASSAP